MIDYKIIERLWRSGVKPFTDFYFSLSPEYREAIREFDDYMHDMEIITYDI